MTAVENRYMISRKLYCEPKGGGAARLDIKADENLEFGNGVFSHHHECYLLLSATSRIEPLLERDELKRSY